MSKVIEINNTGPIVGTFRIEMPGAGLYVLEGGCGVGKSTTIEAIDGLINGSSASLTLHDGEIAGHVSGFGVLIPVGSRGRSRGDLEVNTLDTKRYGIKDITDPGFEKDSTNDVQSIRALASLCRAKTSLADYYHLLGDRAAFESIVKVDKIATDDPVQMAAKIKRDIEAAALIRESNATAEAAHAKACAEQTEGVDLDAPSDQEKLDAAADAAVGQVQTLFAQRQQAQRAAVDVTQARLQLADLAAKYAGPTIQEAIDEIECCEVEFRCAADRCLELDAEIKRLQSALLDASAISREKRQAVDAARAALLAAQQHVKLVDQCEQMIAKRAAVPSPTAEAVQAADAALVAARAAQQQGVRVRDALKTKARGLEHQATADRAAKQADRLRKAAASTFDVLAGKVKLQHLRIESVDGEPRLVVPSHSKRHRKVLYRQLSDGERVKLAMHETAAMLPAPALFPLGQRLFQDLGRSDRAELHELAVGLGLYVIGAQVTDGELTVRAFSEDE